MKSVLIAGDSWGCGEWGYIGETYQVLHKGLEQYLIDDGFSVTNCSKGGRSNSNIIDYISCQLSNNEFDHILWIQTDPVRDLRPYANFSSKFTSYNSLLNESNRLLNLSYDKLNQFGKKIICIGGCSKLDSDIRNYKNLIPLIDSIIEFLLPDFTAPEVWHSDWIKIIDSTITEDLLDQLLINKKLQDRLRSNHMFQPDGMHPNRMSHRILYTFIKNFIEKDY